MEKKIIANMNQYTNSNIKFTKKDLMSITEDMEKYNKKVENDRCFTSSIQSYLFEIGRYKLLTKKEEFDLFKKYKENGDEKAKEKLYLHNLRLVVFVATRSKLTCQSLELMDLIMEGNIGLSIAIEKFDPDLGFKFSTYASNWILSKIGRAIQDYDSMIRVPTYVEDLALKYKRYEQRYKRDYNTEEFPDEIAMEQLGIEEIDLKKVKKSIFFKKISSYDITIGDPSKGDNEDKVLDFIIDEDREDDDFIKEYENEQFLEIIDRIINKTFKKNIDRDKDVIYRRFGIKTGQTENLQNIGNDYGLTRERVRQIEKRFLNACRDPENLKEIKLFSNKYMFDPRAEFMFEKKKPKRKNKRDKDLESLFDKYKIK